MDEPATPQRQDPWAHRRGEPRTFAALWIAFLFASALVSLGAGGSLGLVATDVYRASARVLVVLAGVGIGVLWPMLRLSQEPPTHPHRAMVHDFIVVAAPLQAIAWPQVLPWMAAWPLPVVAALAAHFAAWSLIISAILALFLERARHDPRSLRAARMGMIVALAAAAPVLRVCLGGLLDEDSRPDPPDLLLTASPITGGWEIARDRSWSGISARVSTPQWGLLAGETAAGLAVWGIGGVVARRRRPA
ncbi:hypothetical protein PHYC_02175 [Phycisphaerales bacterium]|nr:hypothetical protein PHYC_02175 [Phycisphaerales bacterium]